MAQQNWIEVKIPTEEFQTIKQAVNDLRTYLSPHLTRLSAEDRMGIPKMGAKTLAFVQKAFDYSKEYQELVPSYLDLEALAADIRAVKLLHELEYELAPLVDALRDSIMLSGSEAYQGALMFYNNVKIAARANVTTAGTIYEDLSARFPARRSAKEA